MFYSENLLIRKPLVIATPEQLAEARVLERVHRMIGKSLVQTIENPTLQLAVACEAKRLRTKVTILTLGRYFTVGEGRQFPVHQATPEQGVFYQPELSGSPSGAVSTFAEDYANQLISKGASILDGYAIFADPDYLARKLASSDHIAMMSE